MIRSKAIMKAAREMRCTLVFPGCRVEPCVMCHSNNQVDGKGTGIKAHDIFIAAGCPHCHDIYDGRKSIIDPFTGEPITRAEREAAFNRGLRKTWLALFEMGVLRAPK